MANPSPLESSQPTFYVLASLPNPCVGFSPPELSEPFEFDTKEMRKLLDAHNLEDRDWLFGLMKQSKPFNPERPVAECLSRLTTTKAWSSRER
ncbi:hypothetical protein Prudu_009122 [Prunus dulcis]|uniref:Uncharacterized protein n=1 Tax=Prunus dulcis TaxID=3755 RepID=A0A4Y1R5Q1_PRUDU|nr:hypothetical protein Prudu_009122 [Prunus dulcis]